MKKIYSIILLILSLTSCAFFFPVQDSITINARTNPKVAGQNIPRTYYSVLYGVNQSKRKLRIFSDVQKALNQSLSVRGYELKGNSDNPRQLIRVEITPVYSHTTTYEYEEAIYGVTDVVTRDRTTYDRKQHAYVSHKVVEPNYGITGYRKAVNYHTYYNARLTFRAYDNQATDENGKSFLWATEIYVTSEDEFDDSIFNALTEYLSPYFGLNYSDEIKLNVVHERLMMEHK
ncbi:MULTISPECIES: hypothetical protein [unclassified Pantoea]|uniref:hypothetical protein n=1 Tax=unclassified Pantoea TaxID=2630326 RepID=UPI001CD4A0FC|nr:MULTISPECIES: hypothetical protein [unclassified Pantoea]MCA1179805.1 hypothetical protein [Pantoea sp. alder69]MCA1253593.1 hypothetical protein [Pantoea sp. alder70]MCA1268291.1 hypothetical protein [Pantoea sp. alder81]